MTAYYRHIYGAKVIERPECDLKRVYIKDRVRFDLRALKKFALCCPYPDTDNSTGNAQAMQNRGVTDRRQPGGRAGDIQPGTAQHLINHAERDILLV